MIINPNKILVVIFLLLILLIPSVSLAQKTRVLHVGDSHTVGTFGKTLIKNNLREEVFDLFLYGSCGSSPNWWLEGWHSSCGIISYRTPDTQPQIFSSGQTPQIDDLIAQHHPQLIIVELGSNLMPNLLSLGPKASYEEQRFIKDTIGFVQKIKEANIPCLWVGPPQGRNKPSLQLQNLYSLLEKITLNTCILFDSRPLTPYPNYGGDGAHFDSLGGPGREVARTWGNDVWELAKEMGLSSKSVQ